MPGVTDTGPDRSRPATPHEILVDPTSSTADIDAACRASDAELVLLVSKAAELAPGWVEAVVEAMGPTVGLAGGVEVAVGDPATIVDAGTMVSWSGVPLAAPPVVRQGADALPVAAPATCAVVVRRSLLVEHGGLDAGLPPHLALVDFGWRLQVAGADAVRVARAVSSRTERGPVSTDAAPDASLRMLLQNAGEQTMERVAVPAMLELAARFTAEDVSSDELRRVGDMAPTIESALERRRAVQGMRVRSDAEVFERIGRPFGLGADRPALAESSTAIVHGFRLDEVFERRSATKLLIVAYDRIGAKMAGPGVRAWEIAKALAKHVDVTIAGTTPIGREAAGVTTVLVEDEFQLRELANESDVVLVQGQALRLFPFLTSTQALLVVDLYDPWMFETLEHQVELDAASGRALLTHDVEVLNELLRAGDVFICASDRQRDYWLGMLTSLGRIDRSAYGLDPTLEQFVGVVPYGCPDEPPVAAPALKGVVPGIGADDFVFLWSGGTWDWFDPVRVVEAFARVRAQRDHVRLYFMGLQLAEAGAQPMRMATRVRERARELGLADTDVVFGNWVPYDERGAVLLDADVAVLATKDLAESRLAFRSRVLDHFWAGLPTITTSGDELADLIGQRGAGLVVEPESVDQLEAAMLHLVDDPAALAAAGDASRALVEDFRWAGNVAALADVVARPWRWRGPRATRSSSRSMTEDAQVLLEQNRIMLDGMRASRVWKFAELLRKVRRRLRPR